MIPTTVGPSDTKPRLDRQWNHSNCSPGCPKHINPFPSYVARPSGSSVDMVSTDDFPIDPLQLIAPLGTVVRVRSQEITSL